MPSYVALVDEADRQLAEALGCKLKAVAAGPCHDSSLATFRDWQRMFKADAAYYRTLPPSPDPDEDYALLADQVEVRAKILGELREGRAAYDGLICAAHLQPGYRIQWEGFEEFAPTVEEYGAAQDRLAKGFFNKPIYEPEWIAKGRLYYMPVLRELAEVFKCRPMPVLVGLAILRTLSETPPVGATPRQALESLGSRIDAIVREYLYRDCDLRKDAERAAIAEVRKEWKREHPGEKWHPFAFVWAALSAGSWTDEEVPEETSDAYSPGELDEALSEIAWQAAVRELSPEDESLFNDKGKHGQKGTAKNRQRRRDALTPGVERRRDEILSGRYSVSEFPVEETDHLGNCPPVERTYAPRPGGFAEHMLAAPGPVKSKDDWRKESKRRRKVRVLRKWHARKWRRLPAAKMAKTDSHRMMLYSAGNWVLYWKHRTAAEHPVVGSGDHGRCWIGRWIWNWRNRRLCVTPETVRDVRREYIEFVKGRTKPKPLRLPWRDATPKALRGPQDEILRGRGYGPDQYEFEFEEVP